jgi:hypothetical protein
MKFFDEAIFKILTAILNRKNTTRNSSTQISFTVTVNYRLKLTLGILVYNPIHLVWDYIHFHTTLIYKTQKISRVKKKIKRL